MSLISHGCHRLMTHQHERGIHLRLLAVCGKPSHVQDTTSEWALYWNANDTLIGAAGHRMKIAKVGHFSTISMKDAVARMADWRYSGALPSSVSVEFQRLHPPTDVVYLMTKAVDDVAVGTVAGSGDATDWVWYRRHGLERVERLWWLEWRWFECRVKFLKIRPCHSAPNFAYKSELKPEHFISNWG